MISQIILYKIVLHSFFVFEDSILLYSLIAKDNISLSLNFGKHPIKYTL